MQKTLIEIEHLSKKYTLGVINNGALFRDIQSWWALKHVKEDPHSVIGEDVYPILSLESCLEKRCAKGGVNPERVKEAILAAKAMLSA